MRRWHSERHIASRNAKQAHRLGKGPVALGRYRKRDAFDCGKAGCMLCHGEKVVGVVPRSVRMADVRMAEQVSDFQESAA